MSEYTGEYTFEPIFKEGAVVYTNIHSFFVENGIVYGIYPDGSMMSMGTMYASFYCDTAAGSNPKIVSQDSSLENYKLLKLSEGVWFLVRFKYTNTNSQPQLTVNNKGPYRIYYRGKPVNNQYLQKDIYYMMVLERDPATGSFVYNIVGNVETGRKENTVVGTGSYAQGNNLIASGDYSHAEGDNTEARAKSSHAEGLGTIATSEAQHVQGKFNVINDNKNYIDIVGNGTNAERSNAFALDTEGNGRYLGNLYVETEANSSGGKKVATEEYVQYHSDALIYKGVVHSNDDLPARHERGWTYKIGTDGTYGTHICEVGDIVICNTDGTVKNDAHWDAVQAGDGSVVGPANVTDSAIALFDGTNGKVIKNSIATLTADGALSIGRKTNTTLAAKSVAIGTSVEASGNNSHAEGQTTVASAINSHAEGLETVSSGANSHAEGNSTTASGESSHAEGNSTNATAANSHTEGLNTDATEKQAHAEGNDTLASGINSHAEGNTTIASAVNSHSEGLNSQATAAQAHAEGSGTVASGSTSHTEGNLTQASGANSHAEGNTTSSSGTDAHSEGNNTTASGDNSHSEGLFTVANHKSQHVSGEYNVADPSLEVGSSRGNYVEIVGNGTNSARSNAYALEWNGTGHYKGDLYVESSADSTTGKKVATEEYVQHRSNAFIYKDIINSDNDLPNEHERGWAYKVATEGTYAGHICEAGDFVVCNTDGTTKNNTHWDAIQSGDKSVTSSTTTSVNDKIAVYDGTTGKVIKQTTVEIDTTKNNALGSGRTGTTGNASIAYGLNVVASGAEAVATGSGTQATGDYSFAEGNASVASNASTHAEGLTTTASGIAAHAEGGETTASGQRSHAEGTGTTASADYSHAEGNSTTATGQSSHAEGYLANANGAYSHTEGQENTANGQGSHTEGCLSTANGDYSHAEGYQTSTGNSDTPAGHSAHAEGNRSQAKGDASHAEGYSTIALGNNAHAEGNDTSASYANSHAEGFQTTASSNGAHAEGHSVVIEGQNTSQRTVASGWGSHAEGGGTLASGEFSHAENILTTASGVASHAEGQNTSANHLAQHASGQYNVADVSVASSDQRGIYVEIVGNGTADNARSNARALDWNGNERLMGKLYVECDSNSANGKEVATLLSPALTGTPTAPTPATSVETTQIATTAYVKNKIESMMDIADALVFKGTLGADGTTTSLPNTHKGGWTYKVVTAGTYAGNVCEIGDLVICINDGTTANNSDWTAVQTNMDGIVIGPVSSTDGHVALFDGNTGKLLKDSGTIQSLIIDDTAGASITDKVWSADKATSQLALKVNKTITINGHALGSNVTVTKSDVGLGNCDNTSDADKPISIATQTALDAKAPLASPILTGVPKSVTPSNDSDSEMIATKEYVDAVTTDLNTRIPAPPDTDGEYTLKCIVADSEATYSWVEITPEPES